MLSICIPIYNSNIELLYTSLCFQKKDIETPIEIIFIDDGSITAIKEENKSICTEANYIELPKNIGRAKIRNLFLKHSKYDNLLFLDCDSRIIETNYLKKYIKAITNSKDHVFFGGSIYPKTKPKKKYLLRWEYGSKKESRVFSERKKLGNQAFLTNNFLISRSIFEKVNFYENLTKYGYEDTLFGYSLTTNGVIIDQIDNPVLNNEYDTNEVFLNKVNESMDNLHLILSKMEHNEGFIAHIKLLRTYQSLKKKKLLGVFKLFFKIKKPIFKKMLSTGYYFDLAIFDIYKLGLLTEKLSDSP